MKKTYSIMVDCPNCAEKMEKAAKDTPGVQNCRINFMTLKMKVEFEEGVDEKSVMDAVAKACRRVEPDCSIDY